MDNLIVFESFVNNMRILIANLNHLMMK